MPTLEQRVTALLQAPVAGFGSAYSADPRGWFIKLPKEAQAELILGSFNGIFDALTLLARELDKRHP